MLHQSVAAPRVAPAVPNAVSTSSAAHANPAPTAYRRRLLSRGGGRIVAVIVDEVDWFEAEGNYVRAHVGGESHLLRDTMDHLERCLDPARFARIHRSTIVNRERVETLEPKLAGDCVVRLRGGQELRLSRTFRERFLRRT